MTKETIGGYANKLTVTKMQSGKMFFENRLYGMECYIYPNDIKEYIRHPHRTHWGNDSYSNSVDDRDRKCIIKYLKTKYLNKYKTIDELMKSKSKYKKKYLMQFTFNELQEYIKKKEDKNVKVKSGC